jgi:hypothetical protein
VHVKVWVGDVKEITIWKKEGSIRMDLKEGLDLIRLSQLGNE